MMTKTNPEQSSMLHILNADRTTFICKAAMHGHIIEVFVDGLDWEGVVKMFKPYANMNCVLEHDGINYHLEIDVDEEDGAVYLV